MQRGNRCDVQRYAAAQFRRRNICAKIDSGTSSHSSRSAAASRGRDKLSKADRRRSGQRPGTGSLASAIAAIAASRCASRRRSSAGRRCDRAYRCRRQTRSPAPTCAFSTNVGARVNSTSLAGKLLQPIGNLDKIQRRLVDVRDRKLERHRHAAALAPPISAIRTCPA